MARIVVLGNGQLGRALAAVDSSAVYVLGRADLDLTDADAIAPALASLQPSVVINAAAYNKVDEAEQRPDLAFAVNATAPASVARACAELRIRLIHVSTDYVFDGSLGRSYVEDDLPSPPGVYGASKLAGEHLVRAYAGTGALVVRTSAVFGQAEEGTGKGGNFVRAILRQASAGNPLRVVDDQTVSPTYASDLARAILALVEHDAHGLIHVTNSGHCTWHQFALAILDLSGLDVPCAATASAPAPGRARRPMYSVLSGARLASLGIALPSWRDALARYLAEITAIPL